MGYIRARAHRASYPKFLRAFSRTSSFELAPRLTHAVSPIMRIASSLIAFIFLGVAAAGIVPEIARRSAETADGNGGNNTMSGVPSHTHSSVSHTAIWNGTRSTASWPHQSGSYNGTSHPTSRASHTGSFTGVPTHTSGLPSDTPVPPEPTVTKV